MNKEIIKILNQTLFVLDVILVLLLVIALGNLPYGYYIFLRHAVFIGMVLEVIWLITYRKHIKYSQISLVVCICIAVLFNPIEPIHLIKILWKFIDLFIGGFFSFLLIIKKESLK
jgi:uncharacterized membrane protein YccC